MSKNIQLISAREGLKTIARKDLTSYRPGKNANDDGDMFKEIKLLMYSTV